MYRCIKASKLLYMFDEFDLEDFGDLISSRISVKLHTDDVKIERIAIDANRYGEFLDIDIVIDDTKYSESYQLDYRRINKPRDLIMKYSEPILSELLEQVNMEDDR